MRYDGRDNTIKLFKLYFHCINIISKRYVFPYFWFCQKVLYQLAFAVYVLVLRSLAAFKEFGRLFLIFGAVWESAFYPLLVFGKSWFKDFLLLISGRIGKSIFCNSGCFSRQCAFLSLSKAFDREWHKGLFYKLECKGINGSLLCPQEPFLTNRKQRVVLNGQ